MRTLHFRLLMPLLWAFWDLACQAPDQPTQAPKRGGSYSFGWYQSPDRRWIGPHFWANRLQDWRVAEGRLVCQNTRLPLRTAQLLPLEVGEKRGELHLSVQTGLDSQKGGLASDAFSGFLIGAGTLAQDFRQRALIHHGSGKNGGLLCGIRGDGHLVVLDNEDGQRLWAETPLPRAQTVLRDKKPLRLELEAQAGEEGRYRLSLRASHPAWGDKVSLTIKSLPYQHLKGSLALAAQNRHKKGAHPWFSRLNVSGAALLHHPERSLGAIIGSQFTLSRDRLKLSAQMAPMGPDAPKTLRLEVRDTGQKAWQGLAEASFAAPDYTAVFRVADWPSQQAQDYRIAYPLPDTTYYYRGQIPAEPKPQTNTTLAALSAAPVATGPLTARYDFSAENLRFPDQKRLSRIAQHQPDLILHLGNQLCHNLPTPADTAGLSRAQLDFLYKWYLWHWAHRELHRNTPSIVLPGVQDFYQNRLWGEGGRLAPNPTAPASEAGAKPQAADSGGYRMPPAFINAVQRCQTAHLPEAHDDYPAQNNIDVYYAALHYGGLSIALLEDRKWKSSPARLLPGYPIANGSTPKPAEKPEQLDHPDAQLLGRRQLYFLEAWADDWQGTHMKMALTQGPFADLLGQGSSPNLHTNGWPQSGRNRALRYLRKAHALLLSSGVGAPALLQHGVAAWESAGHAFSLPTACLRHPKPDTSSPPEQGRATAPAKRRQRDPLGNRVTLLKPTPQPRDTNRQSSALGYGIIRCDKKKQRYTLEYWPHPSDAAQAADAPLWAQEVAVAEQYGRQASHYLPLLKVRGLEAPPVIKVRKASGELVYARRLQSMQYRPRVFAAGQYQIEVGRPGTEQWKKLEAIGASLQKKEEQVIRF